MQEEVIWSSLLDNRYSIEVIRTAPYRAEFSIRDGDQVLRTESVGLMYGAIFEPDVSDVAEITVVPRSSVACAADRSPCKRTPRATPVLVITDQRHNLNTVAYSRYFPRDYSDWSH